MKSLHAELQEAQSDPKGGGAKRALQMLMYGEPSLLDRVNDRELRLLFDSKSFLYARHSNSFLLAASEFEAASADYPIVFVGDKKLGFTPAVVLGLNQNNNAMLDDQFQWREQKYVPAFVRRYPFVLMEQLDGQLCVGIDRSFSGFGDAAGVRLFESDGAQAPLLTHATAFLNDFHQHMLETRQFCSLLNDLDLLVERFFEISSGPQSPPKTISGFYAVDTERLKSLPDATILALARGQELRWIHMHLASLARVSKLAQTQIPVLNPVAAKRRNK